IFPKEINLKSSDSTYLTDKLSLELQPNDVKELTFSQTFIFNESWWNDELKAIQKTNIKTVLNARKAKKNTQLKSLIENRKT
ncbi:hypothetical protein ACEWL1_12180, partial [Polaribacter sp. MF5-112]